MTNYMSKLLATQGSMRRKRVKNTTKRSNNQSTDIFEDKHETSGQCIKGQFSSINKINC